MARDICLGCNKPQKSCICQFFSPVENQVNVIILQHPKEVGHAKGTAPLLLGSLAKVTLFEVENVDEHHELLTLLSELKEQCVLLFPTEQSIELSGGKNINTLGNALQMKCIVLIDATWRKALKMYRLSQTLQSLQTVHLPESIEGKYLIRKTKKNNALSTLEACCHSLTLLENDPLKYQSLINSFEKFNQFQLSFRPKEHINPNKE